MMEIPIDIKGFQSDKISVDEVVEVEVECIEVAEEEDSTTVDTAAAAKAANYKLFSPKIRDDSSSDEEDEHEEESDNREPSPWQKRFRSESAKLEYNRLKANVQKVRRQDLVEGIANLRAAIGTTKKEFKTCKKLVDHAVHCIPRAERHIARRKLRVSYLTQENLMLEEKIRRLEMEKASARNTCEQEEWPNAFSHPQSF